MTATSRKILVTKTKKFPGSDFITLTSDDVTSMVNVTTAVSDYLEKNPPSGGLTIEQIKADADIADSLSKKHAIQDLSTLQPKVTGKGLTKN
jgi:hypothetical protein